MGSIYGSKLSENANVTLLDVNENLVKKINSDGITLEESSVRKNYKISAVTSAKDVKSVDLIILFTKALYSVSALDSVRHLINDDTYLMTLQNGAGHEDVLSSYQKRDHIIIGTSEDNGAIIEPSVIRHGGKGITNIGLLAGENDKILFLKETFDKSGFDLRFYENINKIIWDKLMTNVSLSALSAVLQCDMSYIAENDNAFSVCKTLLQEAVEVANAMGLGFSLEFYIEKVRSTAISNRGGYTSIMMDVKNHRATEVDYITGAVLKKAKEFDISVPTHEAVLNIIHALEKKN